MRKIIQHVKHTTVKEYFTFCRISTNQHPHFSQINELCSMKYLQGGAYSKTLYRQLYYQMVSSFQVRLQLSQEAVHLVGE